MCVFRIICDERLFVAVDCAVIASLPLARHECVALVESFQGCVTFVVIEDVFVVSSLEDVHLWRRSSRFIRRPAQIITLLGAKYVSTVSPPSTCAVLSGSQTCGDS